MKEIRTINEKTMPYTSREVWQVLTDIAGYDAWWPSAIKTKTLAVEKGLIGSRIGIRPYGGLGFVCEVAALKDKAELTMKYSGVYSGTGTWKISGLNENCRVSYEIVLGIENIWIRLLSSFLPVAKIHSNLMNEVLSGLDRHLSQKRAGGNTR